MKCPWPFRKDGLQFGCGRCIPCFINHRRMWTNRLLLERELHDCSVFVTLTYNEEEVPVDGSVDPGTTQRWLKRLRSHVEVPLRYFLVGEYGSLTLRPHYHAAIFGFPRERLYLDNEGQLRADVLETTWPYGFYDVREFDDELAQYLVGYTVEKMRKKKDERLVGLHPEFARMSRRPGIGAGAVPALAASLQEGIRKGAVAEVPTAVRRDGKFWPLGRYMKGKLHELSGVVPLDPDSVRRVASADLRAAVEEAGGVTAYEVKKQVAAASAEARYNIQRSKRSL